jgi:hypothetical protein
MLLVIALNTLPLVALAIACWFYRSESGGLVPWKRSVFIGGIAANAISALVLASFVLRGTLGSKPIDLDRVFPVFSMFGLAILAAILASSGRRISRRLLIGNGILTAILWYVAALAASP